MDFSFDKDMRINAAIKELMDRKGFTHEELSSEGADDEICTVRTLSNIIRGKTSLKSDMLIKFLNKLGVSIKDFSKEFLNDEYELFDYKYSELWGLLYKGDYSEATILLNEIKEGDFYDKNNLSFKQALLTAEASIISAIYEDKEVALKMLFEALNLTQPRIIDKKNRNLNLENLKDADLNRREFDALVVIAELSDSREESLHMGRILYEVAHSSAALDSVDRDKILVTLCLNISINLIKLGEKTNEILEMIDEGIDIEKRIGSFLLLPELFCCKGVYYLQFESDRKKAQEFFQKAFNLTISIDKIEESKKIYNWAREVYNIVLDN